MNNVPMVLLLALMSCQPNAELHLTSGDLLPPPTGPLQLHADYMIRGVSGDILVTDLVPGATVGIAASVRSSGPAACPPPLAPTCLDIPGPIVLLGTQPVDASGEATFALTAPANLAFSTVALQAVVVHRGTAYTSNVQAIPILDADGDADGDGLTNSAEHAYGLDPLTSDSDGDGLTDGHEVFTSFTDPLLADTDLDTLSDGYEVQQSGTDPLDDDTDGGGALDGDEVARGLDPLDPGDDLCPAGPCEQDCEGVWDGPATVDSCGVCDADPGNNCCSNPAVDLIDDDGDGWVACMDCDDDEAARAPDLVEICDGLDNDCDDALGMGEDDLDGDGFPVCAGDCDDVSPATHPGAPELCDGVDNDCDGVLPGAEADDDADGIMVCAGDCDDGDATFGPGKAELCDGLDNDCDGVVPAAEGDGDGDGISACMADCDDTRAEVGPGLPELCDGVDNDCDGALGAGEVDADLDGALACIDCDDADDTRHPGAAELCDGVDNDCDGVVPSSEADIDSDGHRQCVDCDDTNPAVFPAATELCDGLDNDCSGSLDPVELDGDGDGWRRCDADCDDANPTVHPGSVEVCDGVDNDCDIATHLPTTVELVYPGPGGLPFSDEAIQSVISLPPGVVRDVWVTVNIGHEYSIGEVDVWLFPPASPGVLLSNNRGAVGESFVGTTFRDGSPQSITAGAGSFTGSFQPETPFAVAMGAPAAGDWTLDVSDFVASNAGMLHGWELHVTLELPDGDQDADGDGWTVCGGDCDDTDAAIHPAAAEICDGLDNDCDGQRAVDDVDVDGDGWTVCGGDCDDLEPTVAPGIPERCDGLDNDCDTVVPVGEEDADGDGILVCMSDCDDARADVGPGKPELCDGLDNDCDGVVPADEADLDGDGFSVCAGDCDDTYAGAHPGHVEWCDRVDNDCDGALFPTEADDDADGIMICAGDCNDADANIGPGQPELCDGLDNDCDAVVPAGEHDADGDGIRVCMADCDDARADVGPGKPELCDGLDNDCDGAVPADELDADGDGWAVCDGDCDDTRSDVHPGAIEQCDGVDNDCDGSPLATEVDGDGDGAMVCGGDCDDSRADIGPGFLEQCDDVDNDCDGQLAPEELDQDGDGWTECTGDCDDTQATVFPGAAQLCDGLDNNCSTPELVQWDVDGPSVGVGPNTSAMVNIDVPPGIAHTVALQILVTHDVGMDAVELRLHGPGGSSVLLSDNRGAGVQVFDNVVFIDSAATPISAGTTNFTGQFRPETPLSLVEGEPVEGTWSLEMTNQSGSGVAILYGWRLILIVEETPHEVDDDGDGWFACEDCDDTTSLVSPSAPEACNAIDDDCDGVVPADEVDADGDGVFVCASDCNDGRADIGPGFPELCDGLDNDCNQFIPMNEHDADGDGWMECAGDCAPYDSTAHPGVTTPSAVPILGNPASHDRNCDGVTTKTYTDFGWCNGLFLCDFQAGWWENDIPACGESGTYGFDCRIPSATGVLCEGGTDERLQTCL